MSEIKLVLVGVGGVGKSALTITYVSNVWVPEYDPTIEDSHRKQVSVDDVVSMLDILDTAGQEEYSSMQDQWFRQGQGFLVVYSIVNRKSFGEVAVLRQKIERIKDSKEIPMVLVGNKSDLEDEREVKKEEGQQQATTFNCPFFETSAKDHVNVDEAFRELVREVRQQKAKRLPTPEPGTTPAGGSASSTTAPPKEKKKCTLL
eukprot:CAMPEP_0184331600 /NCGR_PEP_ID=MMETSP1089-20130417/898_1 /TAXON_ID=38269 ORGANISM="Gloeochaete wittrockiana, Strain SAG46.84" /NCGR_SAMPLE_ID=MMETSP1089 /ASSEMBLY_ACC=CAM_ASM_000445 /LENGTH=202 /DNA_ID=CAMNT_0026654593 /DNA_START=180 /DNA_END=788 /DNA_ORIENTATION=+